MKIFKIGDLLPLLLTGGVILIIAIQAYAPGAGEPYLFIKADGGEYIYPLDTEAEIQIEGPLGNTLIHIHDGEAFFLDSPCPDKLCVRSTAVFAPGHWNACLPNRVFISVRAGGDGGAGGSGNEEGVDDLAY